MPYFTIIAGPNGAGKSSFSKLLSTPGAVIFDADKVKALKEKQYPDIPIDSIEIMITTEYWDLEETAVNGNKNLTVESNLRDDFLINRCKYFKEKGFRINLIFMLLPDVQTSMERVNSRVVQNGHFVDNESIKYNFEYSLKMLYQYVGIFDNVILLDSSLDKSISTPETLFIAKDKNINYIDSNAPYWAKPILDELVQKITTN